MLNQRPTKTTLTNLITHKMFNSIKIKQYNYKNTLEAFNMGIIFKILKKTIFWTMYFKTFSKTSKV